MHYRGCLFFPFGVRAALVLASLPPVERGRGEIPLSILYRSQCLGGKNAWPLYKETHYGRVVIIRHCRVMIRECVRPLLSSIRRNVSLSPGSSALRTPQGDLSPHAATLAVTTRRGRTRGDESVRTTSRRRERIASSRDQ